MKARERQLHLSLDPADLGDSEPHGPAGGVAKERRLADPGLTPDDQDRALPPTHLLQRPFQHLALAGPAPEPRRALASHVPPSLDHQPPQRRQSDQSMDQGPPRARRVAKSATVILESNPKPKTLRPCTE